MNPDALKHAIEQIEMDETMQARVLRRSLDHRKEHDTMKQKKNYKRIAIVAVAAVMALSVTAFAAVRNQMKMTWMDLNAAVETLPEAQEILDAAKIDLTLPETLPGGYTFKNANRSHVTLLAEEQDAETLQTLEGENGMVFSLVGDSDSDGVSCTYEKDGEAVYLDCSKTPAELDTQDCDIVEKNGVTFYCSEDSSMAVSTAVMNSADVPDDLDPEDLDPSAIDVDTQEGTSRSVSWTVDGISYSLSQMDGSLTQNELIEMALALCGK